MHVPPLHVLSNGIAYNRLKNALQKLQTLVAQALLVGLERGVFKLRPSC